MTAQVDAFKHENNAATHLIGQDWQKLIDLIESRPENSEIKSFDGGGGVGVGGGPQHQYRGEDNVLRPLQDVKRLRQKDMPLFGRCPETDNFYTIVCSTCSMILMPHALKEHYEKRHGDSNNKGGGGHAHNDEQTVESLSKVKSSNKKVPQIKPEKSDKSKRNVKSEPTEDVFIKDSTKRLDKNVKKGMKSLDKSIELEYSTGNQRSESRGGKQKNARFSLELQPIVALSPIHVVENEIEVNDNNKELPKNKKRDKKKSERKADKIYDPDKHCGVINDNGKPCVRSILCKVHQVALKRAVPNRTMPYDMLIKILKNQNDEEKIKADNSLIRLPKTEIGEKNGDVQAGSKSWTIEQTVVKTGEPPIKRLKIKEEVVEEDVDQNQFTLPSHLEALIDETLKNLKDVDENETIPIMPVAPKPEPLIKWDMDREPLSKSPSPPPSIFLEDIHWHSSHPKPLATNTFGCRLIGGLMSTCKKLDTLRKHLQSVWTSSASSPQPMRTAFNDVYNSNSAQNTNGSNGNSKGNFSLCKYGKKPNQNKTATIIKKNVQPSVMSKNSVAKRKRRSNSNGMTTVQNASSNASDIISGLLISNPVPVQRTGSGSVPTIPTGVIPVNSITGNGVPLRLFQGSLPVIASASPNQPATFIQLNLCPPK
ncbi:hypothetical protein Phum_PHUM004790 [Pediculus humanus corporis]|uniref:SCA7 domain-containing protein n=1 Tax=Pediculus humanus subsp. corporis TaxID=121224 RepID=E0V981_PEDHC|nr:uncharacterized protein Phum_PHUM004790 [Pediculus humanus corporis]EEB09937.1 hypothetical protein Phum_PHUM004790 [Pediculus humanus corporis]